MNQSNDESIEVFLSSLFNNISSLRAAYIQLQDAHTPYDPEKIQFSDKNVVEELVKLSELKHMYQQNNPRPTIPSPHDSCLIEEIQQQQSLLKTYQVMVKKFQSQIQTRECEIQHLQQQVQESGQKKLKLEKKLKQRGLLSKDPHTSELWLPSTALSPDVFSAAAYLAYKSIKDFSNLLINMLQVAGWDLDAAANSVEPTVVYGRRSHKRYAFETYTCQRIFSGFQEECFSVKAEGSALSSEGFFHQFLAGRGMDPLDMVSQKPESHFGQFCRSKYLVIIHPEMEGCVFGNLDQRNYVASGGHPRTQFYQAFLRLAKSIWLLHRLAHSFDPAVKVFQVMKGAEFMDDYMESVVKNAVLDESDKELSVRVMVMPGFVTCKSVIKSQVYLEGVQYSE